jgi:hypothetical protein
MLPSHDGYWGVDGARTFVALGTAAAIAVVMVLAAVLTQSPGPGLENPFLSGRGLLSTAPGLTGFVLVAGGGLAALNAYWNDGLVASWALAVSIAAVLFWPVASIMAIGTVAGVVVGTSGYALGRTLRVLGTDARWNDPTSPLLCRLLGVDPRQVVSWGLVAGGLFVAALGVASTPLPHLSQGETRIFLAVGVGAVLATVAVYGNGGLLVSWLLVFAPAFGAGVVWFAGFGRPLPRALTFAFLGSLFLSVVVGTVCYTLGTNLRRFFPPRYPDPGTSRA